MRRWLKIGSGIAISVTTIIGLFILLQTNFGFIITDLTGNIICNGTYENPCISEFNVKNPTNYDVDIYSKDQVKLDFSPEIYDYALFVTDGRCGATGSCACKLKDGRIIGFKGWRCTDFTNATKSQEKLVYNFRFPKYSTTKFRLAGIKNNPIETIKWGFGINESYLDPFWYGINTTANISTTELFMELGSQVNITANISGVGSVCVDIDHPDYGDNYSCGTPSANFLFNITYFRNNQLNDSLTIKNISFRDNQANQTIYIKQHQYDEIINASINVTGFINNGTYPTNVKLYINNTLSNNLGLIYSGDIILTELNDSSTTKDFNFNKGTASYNTPPSQTAYFKIPKNAQIKFAYLNFSGYRNGILDEDYACWGDMSNTAKGCDENWGSYASTIPIQGISTIYDYFLVPSRSENTAFMELKYGLPYAANYIITDCYNYSSNDWVNIYTSTSQIDPNQINRSLPFNCYNGTTILQTRSQFSDVGKYYESQVHWNSTIINSSMEIGITDGIHEWDYTGYFNVTNNKTSNFNTSIMTYLSSCTQDNDGYCNVPLYLTTQSAGAITISDIQINYSSNPNPVYLDVNLISSFLGNSTNFANIPLKFESTQNGTLQIDDIRLDYAGGNKTTSILVYDTSDILFKDYLFKDYLKDGLIRYYNFDDNLTENVFGIDNLTVKIGPAIFNTTNALIGKSYQMLGGDMLNTSTTNTNGVWKFYGKNVTMSFWFRIKANNVGYILGNCRDGAFYKAYIGREYAAPDYYIHFYYTGTGIAEPTADIYDEKWYNFVYVKNDTGGTVYINGSIIGTGNSPGFLDDNTYWVIGAYCSGSTGFAGQFDEFGLWNRTLNASEIADLYNNGNGITYSTTTETMNITVFYSDWDFNFPRYVNYLEFIPSTTNSKNVTPYRQTSNTPIFNITTMNYGGKNMNLSIYLNETHSCVNLTASITSNKSDGFLLNNTWKDFKTNLIYLNNTKLWLWADYSCNYTSWKLWKPNIYIRGCCSGCICSEETI